MFACLPGACVLAVHVARFLSHSPEHPKCAPMAPKKCQKFAHRHPRTGIACLSLPACSAQCVSTATGRGMLRANMATGKSAISDVPNLTDQLLLRVPLLTGFALLDAPAAPARCTLWLAAGHWPLQPPLACGRRCKCAACAQLGGEAGAAVPSSG